MSFYHLGGRYWEGEGEALLSRELRLEQRTLLENRFETQNPDPETAIGRWVLLRIEEIEGWAKKPDAFAIVWTKESKKGRSFAFYFVITEIERRGRIRNSLLVKTRIFGSSEAKRGGDREEVESSGSSILRRFQCLFKTNHSWTNLHFFYIYFKSLNFLWKHNSYFHFLLLLLYIYFLYFNINFIILHMIVYNWECFICELQKFTPVLFTLYKILFALHLG